MRQDEIDELLVEWELARQNGKELDASELCGGDEQLTVHLQQRIRLLHKTSWMLEDPVNAPVDDHISRMLEEADETVKSAPEALQETPAGSDPRGSHPRGSVDGEIPTRTVRLPPDKAETKPNVGQATDEMPQIPGFRLISELGRGGFGVVYRAFDEKLERHVAIKFPLIDNPRERLKYLSEARNASQVDVPGLVPVLHIGATDAGTPYVIQKLIDGKSLREIQREGGLLSSSQVADLMIRICEAVAKAHSQSIVHRDLKPENILVDHDGFPWITDFGLAISEDDPGVHKARIAGTPSFMAPEQILGKVEWLDGRCDIWALGIIIYQCLTGRLPFRSPQTSELHDKIVRLEPRPIAQRQPDIRGDWDAVFRKCCAKSIADRYHNALELADDLRQLRAALDPATEKHNPILTELQKSGERKQRKLGVAKVSPGKRRLPLAWITGGGVLAVLLIGIALLLNGDSQFPDGGLPQAGTADSNRGPTAEASSDLEAGEFIVAADGQGTHRTIAAAIKAAKETTLIFIEPGTYRESLSISGKVQLRGRGARDQIKIFGAAGPAFVINVGGDLALRGLSIGIDDISKENSNSIEVRGGSLLLENCQLAAVEYDCLRLDPGSQLVANLCSFATVKHPAVFARLAKRIEISDSQFRIGLNRPADDQFLVGVQIKQSGGSVTRCTFSGPRATGVEWSETSSSVVVNDCSFDSLDRGLVAISCQDLSIGGPNQTQFRRCNSALELVGCGGVIQNCDIDGNWSNAARGILVRGMNAANSPLRVEACNIAGGRAPFTASQAHVYATALIVDGCSDMGIKLLDNTQLRMENSKVLRCEAIGILLERSRAALERCVISNNGTAGIVVDGLEHALTAKSCQIEANGVGLIVLSGSASLDHTNIIHAQTGVLLARKTNLNLDPTCDVLPSFFALGGSVQADKHAVHFLSPGSYRLESCETSDPQNRPVLAAELEEYPSEETMTVRQKRN